MRVITLNCNGIRAAARKGFFGWFARQRADICCLQETRADTSQLHDRLFYPRNYFYHYAAAERRGYSGVAIFSKREPNRIIDKLAVQKRYSSKWQEFDREARYLEFEFDDCAVVSLYMPSGSHSEDRQAAKYRFLDLFLPHLQRLRRRRKPYIICGDWNIAHKEIDLKNWRANQKHSGFLPEERAWMDRVIDEVGLIDAFRAIDTRPDQYTWWSNRGRAWDNNVGWRIDYQIVSPSLANTINKARIYKTKRFSDHAPLIMDYVL